MRAIDRLKFAHRNNIMYNSILIVLYKTYSSPTVITIIVTGNKTARKWTYLAKRHNRDCCLDYTAFKRGHIILIVILHALRVWEPTRVAAARSAATLARLAVSASLAFWVGSHKTATSNRTHRD